MTKMQGLVIGLITISRVILKELMHDYVSLSNIKTKQHNDTMPGNTLMKMVPLKRVSTKDV